MLLDRALELLRKILEQTNVTHIRLQDALNPVYIEYDEETLEEKEDQEYPNEFDLVLHGDLCHAEIQAIDELLADFDYIEMRLRDGKLEIFQSDREEATP